MGHVGSPPNLVIVTSGRGQPPADLNQHPEERLAPGPLPSFVGSRPLFAVCFADVAGGTFFLMIRLQNKTLLLKPSAHRSCEEM